MLEAPKLSISLETPRLDLQVLKWLRKPMRIYFKHINIIYKRLFIFVEESI